MRSLLQVLSRISGVRVPRLTVSESRVSGPRVSNLRSSFSWVLGFRVTPLRVPGLRVLGPTSQSLSVTGLMSQGPRSQVLIFIGLRVPGCSSQGSGSQGWVSTSQFLILDLFCLAFLSRTFTNHRTTGEGGGHFINSSLPLPPASQTLKH